MGTDKTANVFASIPSCSVPSCHSCGKAGGEAERPAGEHVSLGSKPGEGIIIILMSGEENDFMPGTVAHACIPALG